MLYICPLFKLDLKPNRFGYADDIAILAINKTLDDNCSSLQSSLEKVLSWGDKEGINFDPGKSELQHLSRHRRDKNPSDTPFIKYRNISVSENLARVRVLK